MATPRGLARFLIDRFAQWAFGLPRETCSYTITPVRIPLRDGAELAADLYLPVLPAAGAKPSGLLLVQGPYGRSPATAVVETSVWSARGYQVLHVSCRGTYGSGGQFDAGRTEADDGQDIVKWMRTQPWYPGTFATFGASYLGYTQWALLRDPPADLVAAIPSVGPHDYSRNYWGTGAFRMDRIQWSYVAAFLGDKGFFARLWHMIRSQKHIRVIKEGIPLLETIKSHFGSRAPWLTGALSRPDITDEYYRPMQHSEALERVNVPVMVNTGWYDLFLYQSIEQYTRLRERGCDVELIVGPWDHVPASNMKIMPDIFAWMEEHIAKRAKRDKKYPVRIFVTGADEWRDLPAWPPATSPTKFFLQPGDGLSSDRPTVVGSSSSFTYDPLDPTPSVGGPLLMQGGRAEDSSLAARSDVLAFTSEPLDEELEIAGTPSVELYHSSDNPHVDVFARLSAVDAKGRSYNISEGFRRLQPGETPGLVTLEMHNCAHSFKKGTRMRLLVAGGTFPLYSRNLGTDESPGTAVTIRTSRHTIAHDVSGPSTLVLPVLR